MNIEHPTSPPFPGPDSLCESCGYALKSLQPDGDCPECGSTIADSSPVHRDKPLWQSRPGPQAAFNIVIALLLNPHFFFRRMRIDGSNVPPRLFLVLVASAIGAGWFLLAWAMNSDRQLWNVIEALIVCDSVFILSYIEAVGVVYFSRRRGWRVPMKLAERITCYSSLGWVPAAVVMFIALRLFQNGTLDRWMIGLLSVWGPWQSLGLIVLIAAAAMLWFEVLVWIGVRQTKYANSP